MTRRTGCLSLLLVLTGVAGAGCNVGPTALLAEHSAYTRAIQQIRMEQLLKALVMLRYGEPPAFLQVSSISAQYVLGGHVNGGAEIETDGGSDLVNARAGMFYSERPTITFTQMRGKEFVTRMMTPVSSDEMALLTQSGWRSDQLMRVVVESMNGLENARRAAGPTPTSVPEYEDFYEACELLAELKKAGLIEFEYDLHSEWISDPLPASAVTGPAVVAAAAADIRFRRAGDGEGYVLAREEPVVMLRVLADAGTDARVDRLRALLQLADDQTDFEFLNVDKHPVNIHNDRGRYTTLAFAFRSVYSMLFYLSHSVRVPPRHEQEGAVTVTYYDDGQVFDWGAMMADILQVHVSRRRPADAYIAVPYRGHWFYIRDNDRDSKATIMLISTIFNLRAGNLADREPVLTLPVTG